MPPGDRAILIPGRESLHPVLFHIGTAAVPSYTFLFDAGFLIGVMVICLQARRLGLALTQALDAALVAALGGLMTARAVAVAAGWSYYSDHVQQALRLSTGGLSWHGGLVGGAIAVLIYCAVRRVPLQAVLAALLPGIAVLPGFVWLGCFLSGQAWGVETYPGQPILWALSLELPDLYGLWTPRVAVQLLGAGWGAAVFAAVALAARGTRTSWLLFPFWLTLTCLGSFGLGFLRADEMALVCGWRVDQMVDLALAVAGAVALAVGLLRPKRWCQKPWRQCPGARA